MGYSCFASARLTEFVVVGLICVACTSLAYPSRGYGREPGVIPLNRVMSKLQEVDIPEYHSEPTSTDYNPEPSHFTGGAKHKRHGHGYHHQPKHSQETDTSGSCCPTVQEITTPIGGKSKSGHLVELFQSDDLRQQFYEISCASGVAEQPCRFVSESVRTQSRCVQQYSYSYALVRDFGTTENSENPTKGWRFEHIRIRSGCSCIISPS